MPAGFDAARHVAQLYVAFAKVQLVEDFRANEKFHLPLACRCDALTPAEIKIVEGVAR